MKLRGAGEGCEPFANEFDSHISPQMKLYIAVLDQVPDYMVPTLVAHSVLNAHITFSGNPTYDDWLENSFKKCVVRVNSKEFSKLMEVPNICCGFESTILNGGYSCIVVRPRVENPNVLKFAKLWKPCSS